MSDNDGESVVWGYLSAATAMMQTGDTTEYLEQWADDAVLEMPYFPDPSGRVFEGLPAITAYLEAMMSASADESVADRGFSSFEFFDVEMRSTSTPGEFVVEMRSRGEMRNGHVYENRYCGIARTRHGKMTLWREYFDPSALPA